MGFVYLRNGFHHTLVASKFIRSMILLSAEISKHNKRDTILLLLEEPFRNVFYDPGNGELTLYL